MAAPDVVNLVNPLKKYACGGEHSAHLSRFSNGWTGYEQLAGSRYSSSKRAEIEVLGCMRGYHVYKDREAAAVGEL